MVQRMQSIPENRINTIIKGKVPLTRNRVRSERGKTTLHLRINSRSIIMELHFVSPQNIKQQPEKEQPE